MAIGIAWAPSAAAQGRDPGVDQYVPCVPSAGGSDDGCKRKQSKTLPDEVRSALPDSKEGRALAQIATDERLGAPSEANSKTEGNTKKKRDRDSSDSSGTGSELSGGSGGSGSGDGGGASGAVSSAVTNWDDPVVPILAGLILLLTATAAFAGVRRRRRASGA
jgi:hypothetical protein